MKATSAARQGSVELSSLQKEYLTMQIKDLRDKSERYKTKSAELEAEKGSLLEAIDAQKAANKDIYEFQKTQLARKDHEIFQLEDSMEQLRKERDNIQKHLEAQLHSEKAAAQDKIGKLQVEIAKLREEIDDLSEFRLQKMDLENELEELKLMKENERKKHKEKMYELEREVVKEKGRLKKEMDQQVQETRNRLLEMANYNMEAVTKLTMVENDQMSAELAYQSKHTEDLLLENTKMQEEIAALQTKLQLATSLEKDLTSRNQDLHTKFSSFKRQLAAQQDELSAQVAQAKQAEQNLRTALDASESKVQTQKQVNAHIHKETEATKAQQTTVQSHASSVVRVLQNTKTGLESILQMLQPDTPSGDLASELTALLLGVSTVLDPVTAGTNRDSSVSLPRLISPSRVATRTYLAFATPIPTSGKQRNL